MKALTRSLALCGMAAALLLTSNPAVAQNQGPGGRGGGQRGDFDPAQMRERMAERMKEQFGVTNDDEWKIISERIEKVAEARRGAGVGASAAAAFGRGGGRGPGGPEGAPGAGRGQGGPGGRGGFGGQASPEAEDLQKALDANASPEEIKAKLAKVREARIASEAKLKTAQNQLKEVLNTRQEAVAVLMGLLP
jgi:hypothetical protein